MVLCPLLLCLPDQRLLVLPVLLRRLGLVLRRQRQLVVGAVKDSETEGGPSEDLQSSPLASISCCEQLGFALGAPLVAIQSSGAGWECVH